MGIRGIPFLQYILRLMWGNNRHLNRFERKYIALHEQSGEAYWYYKFRKIHPELDLDQSDPKKLRLILGIGRSGTTWIGRMLATSMTPLRYFEEPLHHIIPALSFTNGYNHTAIRFWKALSDSHRLVLSYKLFALPNYDWSKLGIQPFLKRDDKNFNFCLVKEVHSLLATEALLDKFQVPTIIVIRDPVHIVDSLFNAQSLSTLYLTDEVKMILQDPIFFRRYLSKASDKVRSTFAKIASWPGGRRKAVQQRILIVSIMTKMLECVAKNSEMVHLVRYEELCLSPGKCFSDMAAFLGLDWTKSNVDALLDTTNYKGEVTSPYSIKRNTAQQIERSFRVLTPAELEEAKEILKYCKLGYSSNAC